MTLRGVVATGLVALSLVIVWAFTRTGSSVYTEVAEVEYLLEDGRPTLVEFYSNY